MIWAGSSVCSTGIMLTHSNGQRGTRRTSHLADQVQCLVIVVLRLSWVLSRQQRSIGRVTRPTLPNVSVVNVSVKVRINSRDPVDLRYFVHVLESCCETLGRAYPSVVLSCL